MALTTIQKNVFVQACASYYEYNHRGPFEKIYAQGIGSIQPIYDEITKHCRTMLQFIQPQNIDWYSRLLNLSIVNNRKSIFDRITAELESNSNNIISIGSSYDKRRDSFFSETLPQLLDSHVAIPPNKKHCKEILVFEDYMKQFYLIKETNAKVSFDLIQSLLLFDSPFTIKKRLFLEKKYSTSKRIHQPHVKPNPYFSYRLCSGIRKNIIDQGNSLAEGALLLCKELKKLLILFEELYCFLVKFSHVFENENKKTFQNIVHKTVEICDRHCSGWLPERFYSSLKTTDIMKRISAIITTFIQSISHFINITMKNRFHADSYKGSPIQTPKKNRKHRS